MKVHATSMVLLIGVLWVAITVMGLCGLWFPALLLALPLMVIHVVMGSAHDGRIQPSFVLYPILAWALVWALSFVLADHYAVAFAGTTPDFTVLGFHPSFAWIVFGYWLGGVAVLTVGFSLRKQAWLSDAQWEEFRETITRLNEQQGEGVDGSDD